MGSAFLSVENALHAYCLGKQAEKPQLSMRQYCCEEECVLCFPFFYLKATREMKFWANNGDQSWQEL